MSRRWLPALLGVAALLSVVAGAAVLLQRHNGDPAAGRPAATMPGSIETAIPPEPALIDVAVAGLWTEPGEARPIDRPSLTNPVDVRRWVSSMDDAGRKWLVGRLVTQVLYGEQVIVVERRGEWSRVVVPSQPSRLDPRGYPGWLPSIQLAPDPGPTTRPRAVVVKPVTALRDAGDSGRTVMELSYGTTLPVMALGGPWITVARPNDGKGLVTAADVELIGQNRRVPTGTDLVRSARAFSGLPYLWGGASAAGFDCSGFTSLIYAAHGIVIPRDATDQTTAGTPVDPALLEPGDLLFFAEDGGRGGVHHVAMYAGDGQMIHSPETGRTVETVRIDTSRYSSEFRGARRYLPPSPGR